MTPAAVPERMSTRRSTKNSSNASINQIDPGTSVEVDPAAESKTADSPAPPAPNVSLPHIDIPFLAECDLFLRQFPELETKYIPIAKIGEGTFSTVFKAIDLEFDQYDNSGWIQNSLQTEEIENEIEDAFQEIKQFKKFVDDPHSYDIVSEVPLQATEYWRQKVSQYLRDLEIPAGHVITQDPTSIKSKKRTKRNSGSGSYLDEEGTESILSDSPIYRKIPYFVALKRINMTSSPDRIFDEISFIKTLTGSPDVVSIITALRYQDQIVVVTPYFKHQDFRDYLPRMTVEDIRHYMYRLFKAIAHTHENGIIHRDLKPSNFLYSIKCRRGLLVDFGLAQIYKLPPPLSTGANSTSLSISFGIGESQMAPFSQEKETQQPSESITESSTPGNANPRLIRSLHSNKNVTMTTIKSSVVKGNGWSLSTSSASSKNTPGYYLNDSRPAFKASRAGTRGFRAPEVLFKYSEQTTSIDIWSVGVIFLTILTRQYPFFSSPDDLEAIVEVATIFGIELMQETAKLYNRTWHCNAYASPSFSQTASLSHPALKDLDTSPGAGIPLQSLVAHCNPDLFPLIPMSAFDLLKKCLCLNFHQRISANVALQHPFFEGIIS